MNFKFQLILTLHLTCASLFGQVNDMTIVYGRVSSPLQGFKPASCCGVFLTEYKNDGRVIESFIEVDSLGRFWEPFPKQIKVELSPYYNDYHEPVTTVHTESKDSILVNFWLQPKAYKFTEEKANQDISNGLVQLITFDSLIYYWNQRINYSDQLGFNYLLFSKPLDRDYEEKIFEYNSVVENHLSEISNIDWRGRLNIIEDSLIHLEADNHWIDVPLDLNTLMYHKASVIPGKMQRQIKELDSEFNRLFRKSLSKNKNYSTEFVLDKIDSDSNYHYLFVAEYWLAYNYQIMIPELIKRITNKTVVGLVNSADLIIWERIQSEDLNFYGHGGSTPDDLFTVAGRANHLLRNITGEEFGYVSMYSKQEHLEKLQKRWAYWLLMLNSK